MAHAGGTNLNRRELVVSIEACVAIAGGYGSARVAMGGVAHRPWRIEAAEAEQRRRAKSAASAIVASAKSPADNAFKLPLTERTFGAVLVDARA